MISPYSKSLEVYLQIIIWLVNIYGSRLIQTLYANISLIRRHAAICTFAYSGVYSTDVVQLLLLLLRTSSVAHVGQGRRKLSDVNKKMGDKQKP